MTLGFNLTPAQARRKWSDKLRSGDVDQGKGVLHIPNPEGKDELCCLGVACLLFQELEPENALDVGLVRHEFYDAADNTTTMKTVVTYDGEATYLPSVVQRWLGVTTSAGMCGLDNATSLAILNDRRESFDTIALVIDSEPRDLVAFDDAEGEAPQAEWDDTPTQYP